MPNKGSSALTSAFTLLMSPREVAPRRFELGKNPGYLRPSRVELATDEKRLTIALAKPCEVGTQSRIDGQPPERGREDKLQARADKPQRRFGIFDYESTSI